MERKMKRPQILLIGLGGVGGYALEFLVRAERIVDIVAADTDGDWGRRKVETAQRGATLQGFFPRIEFVELDLNAIDATAELIDRLQPELIFNCATAQTWWVRRQYLAPEQADRLAAAGAGPWLATHLALARKLMLAIQSCGWAGPVINSGFADASNTVLARNGLEPTMGLGNIDLIVPGIRNRAAKVLDVPVDNVQVLAVMHHYHLSCFYQAAADTPPYFLRIMVGDRDVTGVLDAKELVHAAAKAGARGQALDPLVAASGVKNALGLLYDSGILTHTNGPRGLPGGYPVRVRRSGVELFLPQGLSLEEAVRINEDAQRGDGIERIGDDGTVFYTDQAVQIMKDVLDYDLKPLRFDEIDGRCDELVARFRALTSK